MADFAGGTITLDAGVLLLGAADRAIGLTERFARCFTDARVGHFVEHDVHSLVLQRVAGIALGYEDLVDHDRLRHDRVLATLAGKLGARRAGWLAGKSTLNRLELGRDEPTRYHRIGHDPALMEALFADVFLDAHRALPGQIVLDLDATDDPIHGHQEGRFFHGYYDSYCYLPLYIFCVRHLLASKLRPSNIDGAASAQEEVARIRLWATYWNSLFPTHKPADQGQAMAGIIKNLREPGRMAALRTMIGLSKADTTALILRSQIPALVVMGSRDPDFPDAEAVAQWLATRLHADSLMIDGAGHYPHTEISEKVAPELLPFIARAHG